MLGALMLAPFFVVVIGNVLSNYQIADSTGWNRFFFFLIFILPLMAFVLNTAALWQWASHRKNFWHSLLDFKRSWATIAIALLALAIAVFVPFHDSVHCVSGNPIKEIHNPSQTLKCIKQG